MTIKKKNKTTHWYISKPRYWLQYYQLVKRKILTSKDSNSEKDKAISWSKKHAVDYVNTWKKIGLKGDIINLDNKILIEALPMTFLEALACKLPILSFNSDDRNEIVSNNLNEKFINEFSQKKWLKLLFFIKKKIPTKNIITIQ